MSNMQLLAALASQPRRVFVELAARPRFWFPLLLAMACGVLTTVWYYHVVDLPWLVDESLRSNPRTAAMTEAQRAQVLQRMSPEVMKSTSVVAVVLVLVVLRLLEATWYLLAGKIVNLQYGFRQWFALANWSSLPTLLVILPTAFMLATAGSGQIDSSAIQPLSLNELFFHRHMGEKGYQLFVSLSILQPLAWLLAIIGVQQWSKRSWLFATLFVLLPPLLVYGSWTWFALR